jgi:hypothetical protein
VANPNKAKGSRWELDVRRELEAHGLLVTRPWQEGHQDAGDMHIEHEVVGQAKNYANLADALREGVDGAVRQAAVADLTAGVAFVKRRGRGAAEGYAVMRIEDWAWLMSSRVDALRRLEI